MNKREIRLIYHELGKKVKARRLRLGLTQEVLALEIGLDRTSVSNIEAGKQRISVHILYCLARSLNLDVRQLVR